MLVNCNALAAIRFDRASRDLRAHCQVLEDLKKEMEGIFRRIRFLRNKLSHELPHAFASGEAALLLSTPTHPCPQSSRTACERRTKKRRETSDGG